MASTADAYRRVVKLKEKDKTKHICTNRCCSYNKKYIEGQSLAANIKLLQTVILKVIILKYSST